MFVCLCFDTPGSRTDLHDQNSDAQPFIFVFHVPIGIRNVWVPALNLPDIFYWPFNPLNNFSHSAHQRLSYLSEYRVVAYQGMQNDERGL